jgi:hypothetical protein
MSPPLESRGSMDSSEHITVDVSAAMRATRELGVCEVPLGLHGKMLVRGFLMPSIFTANRSLPAVLESFPRWVWGEWRGPNDLAQNPNNASHPESENSEPGNANDNPLVASLHNADASSEHGSPQENDTVTLHGVNSRSNTNSRSKTASIATSRRDLSELHYENGEASDDLPGSALSVDDGVFDLAELLVSLVLGRQTFPAHQSGHSSSSHSSSTTSAPSLKQQKRRLQGLISLATYYLLAYRVVLAPLDAEAQQLVMSRIGIAAGIPAARYFHVALAARCARVSQQFLEW